MRHSLIPLCQEQATFDSETKGGQLAGLSEPRGSGERFRQLGFAALGGAPQPKAFHSIWPSGQWWPQAPKPPRGLLPLSEVSRFWPPPPRRPLGCLLEGNVAPGEGRGLDSGPGVVSQACRGLAFRRVPFSPHSPSSPLSSSPRARAPVAGQPKVALALAGNARHVFGGSPSLGFQPRLPTLPSQVRPSCQPWGDLGNDETLHTPCRS